MAFEISGFASHLEFLKIKNRRIIRRFSFLQSELRLSRKRIIHGASSDGRLLL